MTLRLTSRRNPVLARIRALGADAAARREAGVLVGDGIKLLREALAAGYTPETVLWAEEAALPLPEGVAQYVLPTELLHWVSPLKNSPGPVFTVSFPQWDAGAPAKTVLALEGVQDPGNVGTVLRTANALGVDVVALVGSCADLWHPKTVRATMGAVFRQRTLVTDLAGLLDFLEAQELPLYGAALSPEARDVRRVDLRRACVAVGSEGQGLSRELLGRCQGQVILPMEPGSESMNAAVAAALLMWQMCR